MFSSRIAGASAAGCVELRRQLLDHAPATRARAPALRLDAFRFAVGEPARVAFVDQARALLGAARRRRRVRCRRRVPRTVARAKLGRATTSPAPTPDAAGVARTAA